MTVANTSDYEFETGLEDFDQDDAVTPRLTIMHKDQRFKDSLSGEEYETIQVIILGLVKQRILWHEVVDDGDFPMCRSLNHDTGFPNMSEKQPQDKRFPWAKAGFDPAVNQPDENGLVRLPCASCQLKEWKSHPDGKKPYCAEQFTLPVLYDPTGKGEWIPAIMSFQKTALKGLKAYLTGFQQRKQGAFMALTEITLSAEKRGNNVYSIPHFRRTGDTSEENWRGYSAAYRQLREFLTADPGGDEYEDESPPAPTVTQPEETGDTVPGEVVQEDPWAEPTSATPAAPAAPAAPSAPTPPTSQTQAAAPAETPAAPADDDDDLPF